MSVIASADSTTPLGDPSVVPDHRADTQQMVGLLLDHAISTGHQSERLGETGNDRLASVVSR